MSKYIEKLSVCEAGKVLSITAEPRRRRGSKANVIKKVKHKNVQTEHYYLYMCIMNRRFGLLSVFLGRFRLLLCFLYKGEVQDYLFP
jgi:hypothetical protein